MRRRSSVVEGEVRPAKSFLPKSFKSKPGTSGSDGEAPDEHSALLPKPTNQAENGSIQEEGEVQKLEDEDKASYKLVLAEFWLLLKGSIPVILAYTLQNSLQTISVLIVGRTSPEDLATAAFSYMFAMCTAWLVALGGSTALDTLASATFTGSSNKHDLGILLQRSFIVLGLFYIPVCVIWIFSEPLFRALGQDPGLSRDSAKFLQCLIPGGLGYIYFEAMKKYLQAQGKRASGDGGFQADVEQK
jgi:MATE family multidrug resistance protein